MYYTVIKEEDTMKEQKNEQEKIVTARVPVELYEEFKQITKAKDETASQVLRGFIRQYVKQASKLKTA